MDRVEGWCRVMRSVCLWGVLVSLSGGRGIGVLMATGAGLRLHGSISGMSNEQLKAFIAANGGGGGGGSVQTGRSMSSGSVGMHLGGDASIGGGSSSAYGSGGSSIGGPSGAYSGYGGYGYGHLDEDEDPDATNPYLVGGDSFEAEDGFDEFYERYKNKMEMCATYKSKAQGMCNPESKIRRCLACKSDWHVFRKEDTCPKTSSFAPNLKYRYEWQFVAKRPRTLKSLGTFRNICVVVQVKGKFRPEELPTVPTFPRPELREPPQAGHQTVYLIFGAGAVLLLVFGGIGMAFLLCR